MKFLAFRKAFSMIEVVFVIVVLGIVSSVGAEIIANVYENYIIQRAQHRASIKTQLALNQITNRLRHVIPNSVGRRVGIAGAFESSTTNINPANNYTVLQWVGSDIESFEAITNNNNRRPGWSGFLDIESSTNTVLNTPASKLDLMNKVQKKLGRPNNKFAVYFPNDNIAHYGTRTTNTSITLTDITPRIVERYKIAWTSYALIVENGDLMLYYNFLPTIGTAINGGSLQSSLILRNVTNFKFQTRGDTTRLKICVRENIGGGVFIPSCKEKAVF